MYIIQIYLYSYFDHNVCFNSICVNSFWPMAIWQGLYGMYDPSLFSYIKYKNKKENIKNVL